MLYFWPGNSKEISSGLVDISVIYEFIYEPNQALEFLQKAIKVYRNAPGQHNTIAGTEAQIEVLHYIIGEYMKSYTDTLGIYINVARTYDVMGSISQAQLESSYAGGSNVDTSIVFRSVVPIFVAIGEILYLHQPWPTIKTWVSLGTIFAGSVLYVITDS
ncbi:GDP-mannose transporter GONST4 [Capsicum chinense]|nr:GDP-mannose transporter GONST4 [Capsicum chinense]